MCHCVIIVVLQKNIGFIDPRFRSLICDPKIVVDFLTLTIYRFTVIKCRRLPADKQDQTSSFDWWRQVHCKFSQRDVLECKDKDLDHLQGKQTVSILSKVKLDLGFIHIQELQSVRMSSKKGHLFQELYFNQVLGLSDIHRAFQINSGLLWSCVKYTSHFNVHLTILRGF